MSNIPEDPKEVLEYLKERMESVMPEFKWYTDRVYPLFRARGYENGKKAFSKETISLGMGPERKNVVVIVSDPNYYLQGEELKRSIASGHLFGSGVEASITRDY